MVLKEISFELPNRPGTLATVARLLAGKHINLAAISVDSTPSKGRVRLIVNDPVQAHHVLRAAGYEVEIREMLVVGVEDRAGSLLQVLETLAREKINVQNVAILVAREGNRTLVAISVSNLPRARRILQKAGVVSESAERLVSNAGVTSASPAIPSESVGLLL